MQEKSHFFFNEIKKNQKNTKKKHPFRPPNPHTTPTQTPIPTPTTTPTILIPPFPSGEGARG